MATDRSVLSLDVVTNVNDVDQDTLLTIVSSKLVRIKWSSLVNMIGSWDKVSDKPFDDFNGNHFTIENSADGRSILSLTDNIANKVHLHTNKDVLDLINVEDGLLTYQGTPVIDFTKWETVKEKPFGSLSDDFVVVQKALTISPEQKHTNKDVLDGLSDVDGELQYNGYPIGGGEISEWKANKKYYKNDVVIQWNAIWQCVYDADPQGTFIEGMWRILSNDWGLMTNRPFKYLSSDFTVDENDNLHINTDNIAPHIDEETKHWFVGETDTGVSATSSIDDTSTDGTDVTWSANKINSAIGDINTMIGDINIILASVTGGIT